MPTAEKLLIFLHQCPFFMHLTDAQIFEWAPHFQHLHLTAGEILFHQGDHSSDVYVVLSGELVGLLQSEQNALKPMSTIHPFESIGELGVIAGEPRSLTVKAVTHTELLKLPGDTFIQLCLTYPQIGLEVMRLISRRSLNTIQLMIKKETKPWQLIVVIPANPQVAKMAFVEYCQQLMQQYTDICFLPGDISVEKHTGEFEFNQEEPNIRYLLCFNARAI